MTPLLQQHPWLPVCLWAHFKVLVIAHKALCGLGSGYLKDRIPSYKHPQALTSSGDKKEGFLGGCSIALMVAAVECSVHNLVGSKTL